MCLVRFQRGGFVREKRRSGSESYAGPLEKPGLKSKSKGVKALKIDGQKITGNVIPFPTDGRTAVKVEVTLGA